MNDLASQHLTGPVSTLRSETAEWDAEAKSWKPPRFVSMTHFRPDGQIDEVEYQYEGRDTSRLCNEYDQAGHLIESRSRDSNGQETKSLYFYDTSSRLARVVSVDANGAQRDSATYTYDESGHKTAKHFLPFDLDNKSTAFSISTEGGQDESDETIWYDIKGRFVRRETFTRDRTGKLRKVHLDDDSSFAGLADAPPELREQFAIQLSSLFGPNRVMATTSYVYDDAGRVMERRIQMASLNDNSTTFQYDRHNNPINEVTVDTHREMQIDDSGNPSFSNEGSETRQTHYDYRYDDQGNWIERISSAISFGSSILQATSIERRDISYYSNS